MYYNIEENKKINNNLEFRELFPNILFPKIVTDETMEEYGYKKVIVNQVTSTLFTKVLDGEIKVIKGIPTINQSLVYKTVHECKEIALSTIKTKREEAITEPINNIQVSTLQDRENIQGSIEYTNDFNIFLEHKKDYIEKNIKYLPIDFLEILKNNQHHYYYSKPTLGFEFLIITQTEIIISDL